MNGKDIEGWNSIMYAASTNTNPEIVITLLKYGANSKIKDKYGKTAWDLIQDNEDLKNTKAYWELNDKRF